MNYYDGNTVTGAVELRPELRDERQLLRDHLRPVRARARSTSSRATPGRRPDDQRRATTDGDTVPDGKGGNSLISDAQPYYDDCSTRDAVAMTGKNIGDELNAAGLSWGWFQGGFRPTTTSFATATGGTQPTSTFTPDQFKGKFADAPASDQGLCNAVHPVGAAIGGTGGTRRSHQLRQQGRLHPAPRAVPVLRLDGQPAPPAAGVAVRDRHRHADQSGVPQFDTANHQYDTSDFDSLVARSLTATCRPDHLPAVSFLKAPGYQDGHAGYSDPIDEQKFIVDEINSLEHTPDWSSTAVVVSYDDSDGWYDHVYSGIHNTSTPQRRDAARTAGLPDRHGTLR